ncbi:MAG: hypothetical protein KDE27_23160, partial [Planctomycetes bacterium]|nr:hypothetical protein [Planctomycetota bacterium]
LRAGDSLTIGAIGKVLASGGSTGGILSNFGVAAAMPGGAGSGGTVLLQTGRDANLAGQIDVLGGDGGTYERQAGGNPPVGARVEAHAGNGSDGFIRFEMPGSPTTLMLPNTLPAAQPDNVAALTEQDRYVSFRTLWYSTGQVFGPEFARYEIHATVDGQSVIYSDDTTVSPVMAGVGSALRLWIQNGQMDLATGDVTEIQPWRTGVATFQGQIGISTDGRNAFRYAVIQDRDVAATVTIEKIVIVFKV